MKKCGRCNKIEDLSSFSKDRNKKDGYSNTCKSCKKEYREINKDILREKKKLYREDNKEKIKEYFEINKEKIKEYQKEYREINKEVLSEKYKYRYNSNIYHNRLIRKIYQENNKDKRNTYLSERRKNDILYRTSCIVRSLLKNSINRNGYNKKSKTSKILGCSFEEFKYYLESKFEDWMTWDNQGLYNGEFNYGWDIDHIIPSSSAKTENDLIKLNHYTNLQPLCSKINRDIKRDNW